MTATCETPVTVDTPSGNNPIPGTSRLGLISRRIFSFPVSLAFTLIVMAVLTARGRFDDPDLWWHLRTGQIIWNSHSIPRTDILSWTTGGHPWTDHEWLTQLSLYGAYNIFGYSGVMLWFVIVGSLLLIVQYVLCSVYSRNLKVAFVGALMAWWFGTVGFSIRPQLLGYLFLSLELLIIHLGRTRTPRWFLALPPLFGVWVNCHGSFFIGLFLMCVLLGLSFIELRAGGVISHRWAPQVRNSLAVALCGSVLLSVCNPTGWDRILYPFQVIFTLPTAMAYTQEWQPLNFGDQRACFLFAIVGVLLIAALWRKIELRVDELAFLAIGFVMAARHARMLFVFGLLAAPVIARLLAEFWSDYDFHSDRRFPNAVMMAACIAVICIGYPGRSSLERQVTDANPTGAVAFIRSSHLTGRMLNDFRFGGYLTWALPEQKVFVDGRADVFEWTGVLDDYERWEMLLKERAPLLEKYKIDYCLLATNSPRALVMSYLPGWEKRYEDRNAVIYARRKNR